MQCTFQTCVATYRVLSLIKVSVKMSRRAFNCCWLSLSGVFFVRQPDRLLKILRVRQSNFLLIFSLLYQILVYMAETLTISTVV